MKRFAFAVALVLVAGLLIPVRQVSAHAQPERADPLLNGTVAAAPATLDVWFSEEVSPGDLKLSVKASDGSIADRGDTTLDLFDAARKHVTIALKPGLGPGTYVVSWHTVSATDGDAADGSFSFFVEGGSASPVASPFASPVATIAVPPTAAPTVATQPTAAAVTNADDQSDDFDAGAFGLAVLVGIIAAVGIYLFWRWVRPKRSA